MQPTDAIKAIPRDPNTIYVIIFMAVLLAERLLAAAVKATQALVTMIKGRNGDGKEKPEKQVCLAGLMESPVWEDHKNATRDTKLAVGRNEGSLSILKRESLLQTTELRSQTTELRSIGTTLDKIAKNGNQD